jgi:transposase
MPGKHQNRRSYRDPDRPINQRLSERERERILTLYQMAGWSKRRIARQLRLALTTVCECIRSGRVTPRKQKGYHVKLTTRKRRKLASRVNQGAIYPEFYKEIACLGRPEAGLQALSFVSKKLEASAGNRERNHFLRRLKHSLGSLTMR